MKKRGRPYELPVTMKKWFVFVLRDFWECPNSLVARIMNAGMDERNPDWKTEDRYEQMYREVCREIDKLYPRGSRARLGLHEWAISPPPQLWPIMQESFKHMIWHAIVWHNENRKRRPIPDPILEILRMDGCIIEDGEIVTTTPASTRVN